MGQGVCSYHLAHEITHGLRRLVLHLACGVGVGAQGKPRIVVAQHTGDCLDIHAVLECQGGEGMTQVVEANVRKAGLLQQDLQPAVC